MKKTQPLDPLSATAASEDMSPEYQFDYRKARPNRFAAQGVQEPVVVTLDPDIAEVFTTAESVNAVLRALIQTMPPSASRRSRAA